jgi:hypothetical protein
MVNLKIDKQWIPEEAYQIFLSVLGELHYSYTRLEHELTCIIFLVATQSGKRSDDVLIALLGGQRMAQLKDTIKRLLRATRASQERIQFADALFLQLGEIQFFRDRLTHYITVMSDYNPECWINMNHTGIRERDRLEDIHFNLFAPKAASIDLRIIAELVPHLFNHYRSRKKVHKLPEIPSWQYKPSMLVRNRAKPRKSP